MITNEEYVEKGGGSCPVCGSKEFESVGSVEVDISFAWLHIKCNACEAEWDDLFHLVGYSLTNESPQTQLQIETIKAVNNNKT
jgi:formate dehydrogenase maturation protein FdhE